MSEFTIQHRVTPDLPRTGMTSLLRFPSDSYILTKSPCVTEMHAEIQVIFSTRTNYEEKNKCIQIFKKLKL
jgi:hypothetical protein